VKKNFWMGFLVGAVVVMLLLGITFNGSKEAKQGFLDSGL